MGTVCLGLGAAHSPLLFVSPQKWLTRVHEGVSSPDEPESFQLTPSNIEKTLRQVERCHEAYGRLRTLLEEARPDVLIIIGDDQGENMTKRNMPPFAIYTGSSVEGSFGLGRRLPLEQQEDTRRVNVRCDATLAQHILEVLLEGGMDAAYSEEIPGDGLGHAHMWPLRYLTPNLNLPIIPIFINAYFPPTPSPNRCYLLGKLVADAVIDSDRRVAILASGGLSHFPRHLGSWGVAAYPEYRRWSIDEAFDRKVLEYLLTGEGEQLAKLTSQELSDSGNLELRNWIALAGALGKRSGELVGYEAVYTVAIGMGFAAWPS